MTANAYAAPIAQSLKFFNRTCSVFRAQDAGYAPVEAQFTVAQHVAHVAQTLTWFMAGGFGEGGFDLDFQAHLNEVRRCDSLADALCRLEESARSAAEVLAAQSAERMMEPLPAGPVMGGAPRAAVVAAIVEHTAHHRGALAVYARLLGYEPPIPYTE